MICINCFSSQTQVTNSRPHKKRSSIWRRRQCKACRTVFTTLEQPSLTGATPVHYPVGSQQPFNLGRLVISIAEAFSHAPTEGRNHALWLAQTVEAQLASQVTVITNEEIEAVCHQVLRRFDELAALQYAAKHRLLTSVRRRGRPSVASPEQPS